MIWIKRLLFPDLEQMHPVLPQFTCYTRCVNAKSSNLPNYIVTTGFSANSSFIRTSNAS